MTTIDVNADAGESFGRWVLGDEVSLFAFVSSANIACGHHAGDPSTMRAAVQEARNAGVAVGAHPGYDDKVGFGRRAIAMSIEETADSVVYQVGALAAIAASEGVQLRHVKPHGAMMGAICRDPELAVGVATGLRSAGFELPLMMAPTPALTAVRTAGHPVIPENAVDLDFDEDGINVIEPRPAAKDPDGVADTALRVAGGRAVAVSGRSIEMPVRSVCVHGDRPNAVPIAAAVNRALTAAGFEIRPAEPWV
ncbi:LamB/YcsF family protein [Nocardioides sp. NPDC087217]|uniref:LamB/YcsF family protein n=1 Tax=Nocardioides sp. NPDC087217 TaxID=3364335 RepID=UPI00380CEF3F